MKKTISLVAVLAAAAMTFGCGTGGVPTEESVGTDGRSGERASVVTGVDDTCPIDLGGIDEFFSESSTLFDVEYDTEGRVLSASFDENADGAVDVACTYSYSRGQLEVVSIDFTGDGIIDEYQYVVGNQRPDVDRTPDRY